ncbi:MAG: replication factor C small subunit [Candidatus Bathyarchaeia archaeon]
MGLEIWAEKYRPRSLDDFVDRERIIQRLKGFVRERNLPHLLFVGPSGTGKTAIVLALAHDLYGEGYEGSILEVSAPAVEKDIEFVRGPLKSFARSSLLGGEVPFRLVIIDEADSLSKVSQQALRRTMERLGTVRFCLIGNFQSRIIDPIQSRCALFVFRPYDRKSVSERIRYVAEEEGVRFTKDGIEAIVTLSRGDLRRAINVLQAVSALGFVGEAEVNEVAASLQPKRIREMLTKALSGDFVGSRDILRELLVGGGLSGADVVRQIYLQLPALDISDGLSLELMSTLGDIDYRLTQGATDEVQLSALLAKLASAGARARRDH